MASPLHQESNAQTILKDPVLRWIVRLGIVALLVVLLTKMLFGRYVNIFGLEVNKKNIDTVKIDRPVYRDTRTTKIVYQPVEASKIVTPKTKSTSAKKDTLKGIEQTNTNGNNQVNQVNGTNNGINGNVTVNNGYPQRHINDAYTKILVKRLTDTLNAHGLSKNVSIDFGSTIGSNEAFEFTKEVAEYLRSIGFSNISRQVYPSFNGSLLIVYSENKIHIDVGMMQ
jgi:hypothetical protein